MVALLERGSSPDARPLHIQDNIKQRINAKWDSNSRSRYLIRRRHFMLDGAATVIGSYSIRLQGYDNPSREQHSRFKRKVGGSRTTVWPRPVHSVKWQDDGWKMNGKRFGRKRSWPNLRHYPGISLGKMRENFEKCQNILSPGQEKWAQDLPTTKQKRNTLALGVRGDRETQNTRLQTPQEWSKTNLRENYTQWPQKSVNL